MKPFVLICNDDGVHAPGIKALADAVTPFADWLICAPHVERSGSGQGISLTVPLRAEKLAPNIHAVDGTPTDCVMYAFAKLCERRPDFVLSGINRGSNIGQDILYSGTVAAAMEGSLRGIPAIAFSLAKRRAFQRSDYEASVGIVRTLFQRPELLHPAKGGVLNVNIPGVAEIRGFRVCGLGRRIYDGQIVENNDPRGRPYFWIGGGGEDVADIPETDCTLLSQGYVTLTTLSPDRSDSIANHALKEGLEAQLNSRAAR